MALDVLKLRLSGKTTALDGLTVDAS